MCPLTTYSKARKSLRIHVYPIDSSGQYATCHSEVYATSMVPTAASKQQISE